MHAHKITTAGALALLLSCQLLVAALPVLDYLWTRINTEHYFASVEDCIDNGKNCLWPAISNRVIGSHEQLVPAVRDPAAVYPPETHALAAVAATAVAEAPATTSPCTQHVPQTTTTPVPDLWLELQRRDVALEDIPNSDHGAQASGPLEMQPCFNGIGPRCKPGFTVLDRGICICLRKPKSTTKAV
ncbi:hypothetical protein G647_03280 [Cladophialophora carrionii CBS 160.54]|uniref:Uncharacterized protein n=1 Tax=Cladophialophora carrionii CBS 160.54 TaxID=1279043 RepID=V9DJL0_9EURO|nr:uncharacterized protein G647_03280 [Cladophialophora carrionii CBS 160.54]ETI26503.1 hypothetical protein G647_03280 [Cladophialophora carrionii CBS 160.54]